MATKTAPRKSNNRAKPKAPTQPKSKVRRVAEILTRVEWPTTGLATYDEAASFLGLSRRTVERHVDNGYLKSVQVSRREVRLKWSDLHAWEGVPDNVPDPMDAVR